MFLCPSLLWQGASCFYLLQSVLCFNAGKGYVNSPWPTFTHETIESQALARTVHRQFFTEDVVRRIYFGNWLRDFSQLNKPSMLKLLGADHTADIVNVLAKISGFKPNDGYVVTNEILGVYRPEEHMDNPERITEDNRPFDSRFRAPVKQVETQIDAQLLSKNYMLNSGHGYVTSADYINKKIHLSVEAMMVGNVHAAFRHFGSALHTLEDFYSHSNFVELGLIELGYLNVFPWDGIQSRVSCPSLATGTFLGDYCYPLVTGTCSITHGETKITILSFIEKSLSDHLLGEKRRMRMRRRRLARRGNVSSTGSTTVSDEIADSIISNATAKLIADRKLYKRDLGIISGLKELVNGAIVNLMGKVERSQKKELNKINRDYVSGRLSSPTHAQLTKDFNFHPLHEIAATLAINAVTMVADLMVEAWHGHTPPSQIVRVMTAFIRHPRLMRLAANVDATNQKIWEITGLVVEQWAQHHPERITRLSVEKALSGNVDFTSSDLSLAHMHEHGHHHADQIEALSDSFHS